MYWTQPTGTTLGTFQESTTLDLSLPVSAVDSIVKVSGQLPPGLRVENAKIVGTAYEVPRATDFTFCLRATAGQQFEDSSYTLTIEGADDPVWVTAEGLLPIGVENQYFILDSQPVDFHLSVIDPDIVTGEKLSYWIASGDGVLPPGIRLLPEGQLVGVVEPLLALDKDAGTGGYDVQPYGGYPFDFSIKSHNGYSSFYYDVEFYDFSIPTRVPRKLNRYYEFIVSVSDGDAVVKRKFKIYLVGDDYLRADNTIMQVGSGIFTADNTYVRTPIWLTPADLGYRRANNYITLFFETLDPLYVAGNIGYILLDKNPDQSNSLLPPGLTLDSVDGEVAGRVPFQPAVTKEYKFTLRAVRQGTDEEAYKDKTFTIRLLGEIESVISWVSNNNLGTIDANTVSYLKVEANTTLPGNNVYFRVIDGILPPGLSLDPRGEIIGRVNQFANATTLGLITFDGNNTKFDVGETTFDKKYIFTVEARDKLGYSTVTKTFTLTVFDPNDKIYSNLYLKPMLKTTERTLFSTFINNGDVFDVKKIYRPGDSNFGVQRDLKVLLYAGIETKKLEQYVAAAGQNHKRKKYFFGEVDSAIGKIPGTNNELYEVVYVNVVDPDDNINYETRESFSTSIVKAITADQVEYASVDDTSTQGEGDPVININVRSGGIRQVDLTNIGVEVDIRGNSRVVDEVVNNILTVEGRSGNVDVPVINTDSAPFRFRPDGNTIKTDSNMLKVSDVTKQEKYISNITNMRKRLRTIGDTDNNFLPVWMRTSQPGTIAYKGYTPCIVLCYCKVGEAENIKAAIRNSNFNFKDIQLDIDRYLIDNTLDNTSEQYVLFTTNRSNV
tara:strand:- start:1112 stop:3616 length:2505 start_codon:yes stop_codon:yes gene_type:complete